MRLENTRSPLFTTVNDCHALPSLKHRVYQVAQNSAEQDINTGICKVWLWNMAAQGKLKSMRVKATDSSTTVVHSEENREKSTDTHLCFRKYISQDQENNYF